MKPLLIFLFIIASNVCFGQTKPTQAQLDSAKIAQAAPLLSENDLVQVLMYLDDKLLARDHKIVSRVINDAVVEARKRKKQNK